jgi:hypothetical protein
VLILAHCIDGTMEGRGDPPFTAPASIRSPGDSSRESIPVTNVFKDAFHVEI